MTSPASHDAMDRVIILEGVPLFAGLRAEQLLPVADIATTANYPSGETIVSQGEEGERLFVVVQGEVEVQRDDKVLARLGQGECFGEMALLDRRPRSATVVARELTEVLIVEREDFREIMALYPTLGRVLAGVLAARLRAALTAAI